MHRIRFLYKSQVWQLGTWQRGDPYGTFVWTPIDASKVPAYLEKGAGYAFMRDE